MCVLGGEGCILSAGGSVIGVGSDIGGSIRMPAFFNGVYGHKPTTGKMVLSMMMMMIRRIILTISMIIIMK